MLIIHLDCPKVNFAHARPAQRRKSIINRLDGVMLAPGGSSFGKRQMQSNIFRTTHILLSVSLLISCGPSDMIRLTLHKPFKFLPGFLISARRIRNVFDHIRLTVKREQVIQITYDKTPEQESFGFKNYHKQLGITMRYILEDFPYLQGLP